MVIYVVYSSTEEVIVCTLGDESKVIEEYFDRGGRKLSNYDREETKEPVCITSRVHRQW